MNVDSATGGAGPVGTADAEETPLTVPQEALELIGAGREYRVFVEAQRRALGRGALEDTTAQGLGDSQDRGGADGRFREKVSPGNSGALFRWFDTHASCLSLEP